MRNNFIVDKGPILCLIGERGGLMGIQLQLLDFVKELVFNSNLSPSSQPSWS